MSQLTQQSSSLGRGMASPEMHPITTLAEIHDAADEFGMWLTYLTCCFGIPPFM